MTAYSPDPPDAAEVNGFCASLRTELVEAYGAAAPAVVVSCPQEVATGLNTNRLAFGNKETARFDETSAVAPEAGAKQILDSIRAAPRIGYFTKMIKFLHSIYACFPASIDAFVIKSVKKSHKAPRYGNM